MAPAGAGFHNSQVRAARALHLKKHRQSQRCFLIEGPALVEAALAAPGVDVSRVFVEPGHDAATSVAQRASAKSIDVLEVDERTMRSLSDTRAPQGVVAVAAFLHRDVRELAAVATDGPCLVLVMHAVSDPGNAGTLIRSAEAFGARCVACGPGGVDLYNEKVVRASMGSFFALPLFRYDSWESLAEAARNCRLAIVAAEPGAPDVRAVTPSPRCALVVGHERYGLRGIPDDSSISRVGIPQSSSVDSLNAAVAGSILLYEVGRAAGVF